MNTYKKYCASVFVAECDTQHEKGEIIELTTKRGKINEHIVHNLVLAGNNGKFYYSITRADGFNTQERAKQKASRLEGYQQNAIKRSNAAYESSRDSSEFLSLGEPIKVGHHSEIRHRALIERNNSRMDKCIEEQKKAESYESRIAYWESKTDKINLSMPESIEYYAAMLEKAEAKHKDLKNNPSKRSHSYSLTYAKKEVNEARKKLEIAQLLWG